MFYYHHDYLKALPYGLNLTLLTLDKVYAYAPL